jgi:hypothetical protein
MTDDSLILNWKGYWSNRRCLCEVQSPHSPGRADESNEKYSWSGHPVSRPRFELGTTRIRSRNANHSVATFGSKSEINRQKALGLCRFHLYTCTDREILKCTFINTQRTVCCRHEIGPATNSSGLMTRRVGRMWKKAVVNLSGGTEENHEKPRDSRRKMKPGNLIGHTLRLRRHAPT